MKRPKYGLKTVTKSFNLYFNDKNQKAQSIYCFLSNNNPFFILPFALKQLDSILLILRRFSLRTSSYSN